ncbi:MAG: SBBP repeat-containing protein [Clostridiales bacterium]|nr:SBBP repeat-containing protein [Clostridiales bacterium]
MKSLFVSVFIISICVACAPVDDNTVPPVSDPTPQPLPWSGQEDTTAWNISIHNDNTDYVYSIAVDSKNSVYVAGRSSALSTSINMYEWWIKKFDSSGYEIKAGWNKMIYKAGVDNNTPVSIFIDKSDNIFIAGYYNDSGPGVGIIRKYDTAGNELVTAVLPVSNIELDEITGNNKDAIYVCGTSAYVPQKGMLLKLNLACELIWCVNISVTGKTDDVCATEVAVDPEGNIIVGGYAWNRVSSSSNNDSWFQRYSPDGQLLLEKTFTAHAADYLYDLTVDSHGNIYTAGEGYGILSVMTQSGEASCSCFVGWINKFDSSGNYLRSFTSMTKNTYDSGIYSIVIDRDDNIFFTGYDKYANNLSGCYWILRKINAAGEYVWDKTYDLKISGTHFPYYQLILDHSNNLYAATVAKNMYSAASGYDWWIKKFY